MTQAGRIVELARYRIPAGQRAVQAQRIDGRVAVMDVPVDHDDRVYLIERHIQSRSELDGLAAEYAQHSQACGMPAILATLRSARDLADAIASPMSATPRSEQHTDRVLLPQHVVEHPAPDGGDLDLPF